MSVNHSSIVNLAGYAFVTIPADKLPDLRAALKKQADDCDLKGTILLSTEGINAFVAGKRANVDAFVDFLQGMPEFADLEFKESYSDYLPFNRMLVHIKQEIIPMGDVGINPEREKAPTISAETLRQWYQEKKDMVVLDMRNAFEVQMGTFDNAIDLHLHHFRELNEALDYLPADMKEKPIVTFCTGGIRCEKGAPLMLKKGFKEVYQLDGGILKYFETCGGDFYHGDCFVFDQRVALNSALLETDAQQCFDCRTPLRPAEIRDHHCPHCGSGEVSS